MLETPSDYPSEEKQFWNETVLPALDKLKKERPDNEDLQFLDMVIRNRQFLAIKDFKVRIDGVSLRISPEETKETALAKLNEFFSALQDRKDENEDIYTPDDQRFWREDVIPSLNELKAEHEKEPGFKLLTLMIEKRMLTPSSKNAGLDITVKGIRLRTNPKNKKRDIQRKLREFLEALKKQSVPEKYLDERVGKTRDEVKGHLSGNWKSLQKKRVAETEQETEVYRYNAADKLLWHNYIIPNLEGLLDTHGKNREFKKLVDAIYGRSFLTGGDWKMDVDGVQLDVDAGDSQDEKQKKLKNFLLNLQEATYTRPDKNFWNDVVLPGMMELQEVYGDDREMQLLVMTIEERLFHETRRLGGLNVSISGVQLRIEKGDTKLEAQEKLRVFIDTLKQKVEKDGLDIVKKEMDLRIERLERELKQHAERNKQLKGENRLLKEKRQAVEEQVGDMRVQIRRIERRADQAESRASQAESEARRLKSSGYSSYRPSYSSGGE